MARRVTCPDCGLQFTATRYQIHKFTHRHDLSTRKDPIDAPTLRLLPIEVADDDEIMGGADDDEMSSGADDGDEMMEDTLVPAQTVDRDLSLFLTMMRMIATPLCTPVPSPMITQQTLTPSHTKHPLPLLPILSHLPFQAMNTWK